MATINRPAADTGLTTHEGAPAKRIDAEAQLRRTVMACLLWEDTFYEGGESIAHRIVKGVNAVPPEVAAEIAVEAREVMHLRHVPLLIVREMAREGGAIVGDTLARVIQRPDELTEFVAIYWKGGKEPLSAQVKRGLAEAFTKFDAYQLAKYDRPTAIRLRDVMFLVHPTPESEEQEELWKALADGTLEPPDTWEVALSTGEDKKEAWTRLLSERKLGGLALLRNLRNMLEAGVDEDLIRLAVSENPFRRVLPFRFIAAAKHAPVLEDVLEGAMLRALDGVEKLPGRTALVVDHSQSMQGALSGRSQMRRFEAATGLAILLREVAEDVRIYAFSAPHWSLSGPVLARVPPRRGFALADALEQATVWGGTNTEDGKRLADEDGYDRIIILTDEQSHQKISDPKGIGYVVNVAAYKNGIGYGAWCHVDGWSEGIVKYIQAAED